MKALITGASSGLGKDFAFKLSNMGYDLILVSRNKKELNEVASNLKTNVRIETYDLSNEENCIKLFNKHRKIDLLINNAGFGLFGEFSKTNLDKELNMIDLNVKAVHILTKLYLKEMIKKDSGRILNVASTAAFLPGPLMSTYYSTKSYVYELTTAIFEELRRIKSNVKVSVLCPGPVNTNFNNVADVNFKAKSLSSEYVAKYAVNEMLKGKFYIVPGAQIKCLRFIAKIVPNNIIAKFAYKVQERKK